MAAHDLDPKDALIAWAYRAIRDMNYFGGVRATEFLDAAESLVPNVQNKCLMVPQHPSDIVRDRNG